MSEFATKITRMLDFDYTQLLNYKVLRMMLFIHL